MACEVIQAQGKAVGLPHQERHLKYRWNGDRVDRYFDYLRDAWINLAGQHRSACA